MPSRLRESDDHSDARVVGWEARNGRYHAVYDSDGEKIGRNPTDRSLERAQRVVFVNEDEFFTVGALTQDYTLDDAIKEIEDFYKQSK